MPAFGPTTQRHVHNGISEHAAPLIETKTMTRRFDMHVGGEAQVFVRKQSACAAGIADGGTETSPDHSVAPHRRLRRRWHPCSDAKADGYRRRRGLHTGRQHVRSAAVERRAAAVYAAARHRPGFGFIKVAGEIVAEGSNVLVPRR